MVTPLEALADAVMTFEGWHVGSRSYRNRNPGNLRDSPLKSGIDEAGYAIFHSFMAGYRALCDDLSAKFGGRSRHKLTPDSTLEDLFDIYAPCADENDPSKYTRFVADFLHTALGRPFTPDTKLRELMDTSPPAPAA